MTGGGRGKPSAILSLNLGLGPQSWTTGYIQQERDPAKFFPLFVAYRHKRLNEVEFWSPGPGWDGRVGMQGWEARERI